MSVTFEEIDKLDEKMEEEYRELFPPKRRKHTFTEVREKYLRRKNGKIKPR